MKKIIGALIIATMASVLYLGFSEFNVRTCMDACSRYTSDPVLLIACYDGCHYGGHRN